MDKFNLPDLCGALADFLDRVNNGRPLKIGGRRAADANTPLPFDYLQVWTKMQLQNRSYHTPHHILPPQTINALPPSEARTPGRCDVVLINTDSNKVWPHSGLECLIFLYVRLILLISQLDSRASYRPVASYFLCRPIQKSPTGTTSHSHSQPYVGEPHETHAILWPCLEWV